MRDIVVIGASAGGVEALRTLLAGLPADLPAAVLIVTHGGARERSALPLVLGRASRLAVEQAVDRAPLRRGRVFVAAPDHHLLIEGEALRVVRGPKENRQRPSIDTLFRSAAVCCGPRVIGVVLSGLLDDGTAGLWAIKWRGGVAIVQDPADATFGDMPQNALDNVAVDQVEPVSRIPAAIARLVGEPSPVSITRPATDAMTRENEMADEGNEDPARERRVPPGTPSALTCPECHGSLWELADEGPLRFRCRVGHAFSSESLQEEQSQAAEAALWAAVRNLDESAAFAEAVRARLEASGNPRLARRYGERSLQLLSHAATIRGILSPPAAPPQRIRRPAATADVGSGGEENG